MLSAHRLHAALLAFFLSAVPAAAQGVAPTQPQTTPSPQARLVPPGNFWSHGTTLNVFAGAAATSRDRAGVAGGGMGWELKPWFALEGTGGWFDWGHNANAFTAALAAHVAVLTPRPIVPFLAGGVGMYHATFDRFDTTMPRFYRHRMLGMSEQPGQTKTFTDPSIVAGGGVELFVSRHWTVRPEVMANVVVRDGRSFTVTTGVVRLGYHFEDHPITP